MTHRLALASVVLVFAGAVAGCSELPSSAATDTVVTVPTTTVPTTTVPVTTVPVTTVPVTTVPDTTVPTTTVPTTTVPDTTVPVTTPPTLPPVSAVAIETRQIGTSVAGRPITAVRRGEVGGRVVLVIGVIHGDEAAGAQIVDLLGQLDVPVGIDLWLVPSMNPDGQADVDRHNANQVDLNRNFPYKWGPIGSPGDGQYAGTGPASEPETQAMVAFIDEIRPDLVIWYHQDLFRIAPGTGRDGTIRARYAELVGLPVVSITGGTYTGVAATWARRAIDPGVAFIVELGPTLSADEAEVHARAVLTVASEAN
jgi:murein peptide amidase A